MSMISEGLSGTYLIMSVNVLNLLMYYVLSNLTIHPSLILASTSIS